MLGKAWIAMAMACALVCATAAPSQASSHTRAVLRALGDRHASLAYDRAVRAVDRLRGERQRELRGAIADVDGMAASGQLTRPRLAAVSLTLLHNRMWWTRKPLLAAGARIGFGRSGLVWQHYPGHGLQIQWLATFGKANSLWRQHRHTELRRLLDQAIALAAPRAHGIAWEYLLRFDGARPPWVSGLAQGTAMTALTRASRSLHEPRYLRAAHDALGIFRAPPPLGVRLRTRAGYYFVQYSSAPHMRILNGFVQALNGLSDLSRTLRGHGIAHELLRRGDAEALAELPSYDMGGWSLYSNAGDASDVGYHKVLRDFLQGRCNRGGNRRFCAFANALTRDLHRAPRLRLSSRWRRPREEHLAPLRVRVDKPARVTLTVVGRRYREVIREAVWNGAWVVGFRPPHAGPYRARLTAVDLVGNTRSTSLTLHVRPA